MTGKINPSDGRKGGCRQLVQRPRKTENKSLFETAQLQIERGCSIDKLFYTVHSFPSMVDRDTNTSCEPISSQLRSYEYTWNDQWSLLSVTQPVGRAGRAGGFVEPTSHYCESSRKACVYVQSTGGVYVIQRRYIRSAWWQNLFIPFPN